MGFRTAPRRCAAWKRTAASARFGSTDDTTSPGRMPRAASPAATRSASRSSSAYESRTHGGGRLAPRFQAPRGRPDERAEGVEVGPHVEAAVRARLEAADRPAELDAGPGGVHGHLEGALGRARHVGEGGDGAAVER